MFLHISLYDFFDRCIDEERIDIGVDNSWIIGGFIVPQEHCKYFLYYIQEFMAKWHIKTDKNWRFVSEAEWFGI